MDVSKGRNEEMLGKVLRLWQKKFLSLQDCPALQLQSSGKMPMEKPERWKKDGPVKTAANRLCGRAFLHNIVRPVGNI
jgi:hypothetical protein